MFSWFLAGVICLGFVAALWGVITFCIYVPELLKKLNSKLKLCIKGRKGKI